MTIKELKNLLKGLPSNMTVVIGMNGSLQDICFGASQPLMIKFNDSDEKRMLFLLAECTCKEDSKDDENNDCRSIALNSKIDLN